MLSLLATRLATIAAAAGEVILRHYREGTTTREKRDRSPVTLADEEAEALIVARLKEEFADIPIVAEEAAARGETAAIRERFFLVDPLDGTKEFLARNGEFTVNIALIEKSAPLCGVVYAPVLGRAFVGEAKADAAFELRVFSGGAVDFENAKPIRARKAPASGLIAMVSRSHRDTKTEEYLARYDITEMKASGSSLKFCLIAAGEGDLYPRHGRTMEWDIAAGHAVLSAAGGSVTRLDGAPLAYGKVADNFANPFFVARGRV